MKYLDGISSPADLRRLTASELPAVCGELRSEIVDVCSRNPGHLASSLGAVELVVGIHYVFDTPYDKVVFDVGHQAYAHKILTGRREAFGNLRTREGASGFPQMSESPYDAFGVGHSSTSVSAALGYAEAARIKGEGYHSIALIGDGALTGGLALEALNNAGASKSDIIVILNDNNQSIDPNRGGLHEHLLRFTLSKGYNRLKEHVWNSLPDKGFRAFIQRWVRSLKSWVVKKHGGDLFESLGLRYFGPIDGNDVEQVVKALENIKNIKGPRILHCITVKGKGYAPAEADPTVWHAPGKFDPATGERKSAPHTADRYQDVFGEVLCELAEKDSRVVGITPAMATGCGMTGFAGRFPSRFFDVGIEEEHAVTFSAGLAAAGLKPFCNIYSAFSQRAYDQIIHDVALQGLPVVLCFDRAGVVGEDGATHHGMFDIAAYRSVPGCIIAAPSDEMALKNLMYTALHHDSGPFIIRYPRGMAEGVEYKGVQPALLPIGKAACRKSGSKVAVIACGPYVHRAMEAAEGLEDVGVYDFSFIKPFDTEAFENIAASYRAVLTVEDGCLKGGLFGEVCERAAGRIAVRGLGVPDAFVTKDTQAGQRAELGLDVKGIRRTLEEMLGASGK